MENKPRVDPKPRRTLIDVYRDELTRHCEQMKEVITLHKQREVSSIDSLAKAHEDGLSMAANAKLAQIEAAGSCCPRCGHCKDASTAAEEGDDHGPL